MSLSKQRIQDKIEIVGEYKSIQVRYSDQIIEDDKVINTNDIARITIRTTRPLLFDKYSRNRITGSLILINEATNETVGAAMIV